MTHPDEIAALAACKTPLSDHVASFWNLLKTETVHLSVNIRRVIGHDAPAGPTVYYDCSTFSDDVAKELVRLSATSPGAAVRVSDELRLEWRDGAPEKNYAKEWFIALLKSGDRVVLTALPEEYSYDFKTADDTYIKADKIKRWMQFPDSQFIAPATPTPPSADVARQTIEACRLAIEYSMDMGCSDPACVLLQALNKCDAFLIQSAAHGGGTESNGAVLSRLAGKPVSALEAATIGGSKRFVEPAPIPSDPAQEPDWKQDQAETSRLRPKTVAQEPEAAILPAETVAWAFIDHHQAAAELHGPLTDLVRRARNDTRPVSLDREAVKDELRAKIMDLPRITETRSGVVRSYVALDDVIGHMNGDAVGTPPSPPSNAEDEFRVIPGFEDYEITRSGSARRIKPLRCDTNERPLLNSRPAPTGYRRFFLRVDRKPRSLFVHRAVALAWIGVPSADKPCVAHLDGNRTNNHVDNLAWVSYAENERHKSIHGTHPVGAARAASKMKDEDVVIARRRFSTGEATIKELADEYGIRMTTMSDLINGRTWTHLPVFPAPVQEPRP